MVGLRDNGSNKWRKCCCCCTLPMRDCHFCPDYNYRLIFPKLLYLAYEGLPHGSMSRYLEISERLVVPYL